MSNANKEKKNSSVRNEQVRLGAGRRAFVMAQLKNTTDGVFSHDLADNIPKDLRTNNPGKDVIAIKNLMYNMERNGLIYSTKVAHNSGLANKYYINDGSKKPELVNDSTPKKSKKQQVKQSGSGLKVDLIKSTGRVQITAGNMVIEIGQMD